MLKTDQTQKNSFTVKVGRSIGQQSVVSRKHPQYLEVAVEKSRKESELNSVQKVNNTAQNDNKRQTKIKYVPVDKVNNKHGSDLSSVESKNQKNNKGKELPVQHSETPKKSGKVGQKRWKQGTTIQSEKWFENQENQKLYEELDQMLTGSSQSAKVNKLTNKKQIDKKGDTSRPETKVHVNRNKKVLPKPAEPEVVLEYKRSSQSRNQKHGFFGPEGTKVWKNSERKQKEALKTLDSIDGYLFDEFSPSSNKAEAKRKAQLAEQYSSKTSLYDPSLLTGSISTNRNHIVADIPIYMPSFIDVNPASEVRPTKDSVHHGNETETLLSLNAGLAPGDPLDTYRRHANPVSERILLEKAEKERAQLEKETLKYFDTGEELNRETDQPLDHLLGNKIKDKKSTDDKTSPPSDKIAQRNSLIQSSGLKTLQTVRTSTGKVPPEDQITNNRYTFPGAPKAHSQEEILDYENYKYSPEGFQAHLERKTRLEKEARILSRADPSRSSWGLEDNTAIQKRNNQYPLDQKNNFKGNLAMDSFRTQDNKAYESARVETHRGIDVSERTYRSYPDERTGRTISERQHSGPGTYRVPATTGKNLGERYENRGVDQDRYSDRNTGYIRDQDNYRVSQNIPQQKETLNYGNSYEEQRYNRQNGILKTEAPYSSRDLKGRYETKQEERNIKTYRQESEDKVEYILQSKSSDSRQSTHSTGDQRQSSKHGQRGMQREDTYEAAIKVKMDREISGGPRKFKESRQENRDKLQSRKHSRRSPIGNETRRSLAAEIIATAKDEVSTTRKVHEDPELNKYFMEPERPDSRSNVIPFYSDQKSQYSKQKQDIREAVNSKTSVQETRFKDAEKVTKNIPEKIDRATSIHTRSDDKQTSTDNLIMANGSNNKDSAVIETKDTQTTYKPPSPKQQNLAKEKVREKTREKLTRQKTKEKTMDSQGPTPDHQEDLELELGALNIEDIEEGLDDNDIYVCYLVTDDGAAIGPMRLDIEDVQVGLPKPETLDSKTIVENQEPERETGVDNTEGMRNRQTGSHGLNEFSSRSHSMLMLTIDSEQQDPEDENLFITKRGKLTFVDLAGSEKVKDSNSTAETLVESNNINRSLLILGNCISSLGDAKRRQGHIPYRDSKLTKLLADSLGGNGVTLMICCITPSSHHASETMNTLRYASRAKKIRTKPVIKMDPREKLILSLKKEIKVLRNENHYLRQQLEFPAKPKGQLQKENDQKFLKLMKETNGKPNPPNNTIPPQEKLIQNGAKDESGLYEMLQEYMVENESLRTENSEMQVSRDKLRQEQQVLYRDNEKLMKRVDDLERRVNQAQNSWQAMPRQASYPDHVRSRDQSPNRGSPQYVAAGGSGNRQPPSRVPPPPDLHLRDPVYTGSPSQGYNSPTGSGNKGKQPNRGQPLKPPHRLNDNLPPQRPVHEMNGHPPPAPLRQNPGSPNRSNDLRMDSRRSSQSSSSDAIRDMNEKLKQELMQLEGQIHQHNQINHRNRDVYGSQGSIR